MELSAQTITMAINGVFAFFLIMGFFFGAARGFKKSALRLTFIVSIAVIMYFVAPLASSWLLTYDLSAIASGATIDIGGVPTAITTVEALMNAFLTSSQAIQDFVTANPSFVTLIEQLPSIVTNLIIFLAGFWVLKIVTWPFYAVAAMKYNKKDAEGNRPKKHRFAGGFMGVVQGTVIALVTFMPIAGVSSMLNVEGAEGTSLFGGLLGDQGDQISEVLGVYENSAAGMIGGFAGMDEQVFDGLTTITVTNEEGETVKIKPRQEVQTGMQIFNDIQLLIDMVEGIQNGTVTEIDWNLVEDLVNKIFDLNTIELMIEEYAPYLAEEVTAGNEYGYDDAVNSMPASDDVRAFIEEFILNLDEATIENFKSDAMAIVNVGRALDEHGVIDIAFDVLQLQRQIDDAEQVMFQHGYGSPEYMAQQQIIENLEVQLQGIPQEVFEIFASNRAVTNDVIRAILGSHTLQTLMPEGINVVLGIMEEQLNKPGVTIEPVTLTRIVPEEIDWDVEAEVFTDIIHKLIVFAYDLDPFELANGDVDEMDLIGRLNLSEIGDIVNKLRDQSQLFGGVYSSIVNAIFKLTDIQVADQYVDFDALILALETTDWSAEFELVESAIDVAVKVEAGQELFAEDVFFVISQLHTSDLLEIALDGAINGLFIDGLGETEVPTWASDLDLAHISANAQFFSEVFEFAMFMANNEFEDMTYAQLDTLVAAIESLNTNIVDDVATPENEVEVFKGFLNNLIQYALGKMPGAPTWATSLDVDDFINNVDTIAELFKVGVAINDGTIVNYNNTQINALFTELDELDNMSPELKAVLQGLYDDFALGQEEFLVAMDVEAIVFAEEFDVLEEALRLYIYAEKNNGLNETRLNNIIVELEDSYLVGVYLQPVVNMLMAEEVEGVMVVPAYAQNVSITWLTDNAGLVVEIAKLFECELFHDDVVDDDCDLVVDDATIDAILLQVENIALMSDYSGFATFVEGLIEDELLSDPEDPMNPLLAELTLQDALDNADTVAEVVKFIFKAEDNDLSDLSQANIDALVLELGELNNMSPQLVAVLQAFVDDTEFIGEEGVTEPTVTVANLDFVAEAQMIGQVLEMLKMTNATEFPTVADFMTAYEASEFAYLFTNLLKDTEVGIESVYAGTQFVTDVEAIVLAELADLEAGANNNTAYDLDEAQVAILVHTFNIQLPA